MSEIKMASEIKAALVSQQSPSPRNNVKCMKRVWHRFGEVNHENNHRRIDMPQPKIAGIVPRVLSGSLRIPGSGLGKLSRRRAYAGEEEGEE